MEVKPMGDSGDVKTSASGGGYFLDLSTGLVIDGKKFWVKKPPTECELCCHFNCGSGMTAEYFSDPTTSMQYKNTAGPCCFYLTCARWDIIVTGKGKNYGRLEKYKDPTGCCSKREQTYMEKDNDKLCLTCCLGKEDLRSYYIPTVSIRNDNDEILYEMRGQVPYVPKKGCCSCGGGSPPCAPCVRCINECCLMSEKCRTALKKVCGCCCPGKEFYVIAQPIYKPGQQEAVGYLNKTYRRDKLVGVVLDVPNASEDDLHLLTGLAYAHDQQLGYYFDSPLISNSKKFLQRKAMDFKDFLEVVGSPDDEEMVR